MNTRQLSYIITIAEQGSLSAAARTLSVSQPALSKYLAELEEELGVELFLRHKKQLFPTPAGKIYLKAAQRILSVKNQTYQAIAALSGDVEQTITLGVTPLRGAISIARIFPLFRQHFPNVRITFKEQYQDDIRRSIINQTADLGLGTCIELEEPEIRHIAAFQEDLVLFVPSFHPLASMASPDPAFTPPVDIRLFSDTPFLIGGKSSTIRQLSEIIFQQNNMHPTIVFESDNNLVLKHMVKNGAGVCLLSRSHGEINSNLVYFSLKPNYRTNLTVMVAKDRVLTEAERYLVALNFSMQFNEPNYIYHPNPEAAQILKEFGFSKTSRPTIY